MSPAELCWRTRDRARQYIDGLAATSRSQPLDIRKITGAGAAGGDIRNVRREAVSPALGALEKRGLFPPESAQWRTAAIERADRICANRLTLFDLKDHDLGPQINWNYEYKAHKAAPMRFSPMLDYRDYATTGDCKFVWEPNRHQHLVVLGRAYRLTQDRKYAAALSQLVSWIDQCPFGLGMNWRSPLELGIRLINWVWALELIRPSGVLTPKIMQRILGAVYRHLWEISRKYSRYSSANNHRIGEAAGVFIGSSYFHTLKRARRWQIESRRILLNEITAQTYPDGGTREQAVGYHLFVTEFFLLAGLTARHLNDDFPPAYWERLEKMFEFVAGLAEGGESLPMFGDADDGYVLDLGGSDRARDLLAVAAVLFGRSDFKAIARGAGEPLFWLLGQTGFNQFQSLKPASEHDSSHELRSRAFAESGYYLLQQGHRESDDRISVTFDCGELGFGPIAAHGHADALSFTLRAGGKDVLVDPGTYDYFTYPRWRDYFRGTRAHNTIVVDGKDQSAAAGPFLWGQRANARCTQWEPSADGGKVSGEHDGYSHPGGVVHRRTLELRGSSREGSSMPSTATTQLIVRDVLIGKGRHTAELYLHLAESCAAVPPRVVDDPTARPAGANRLGIECGEDRLLIELDKRLMVEWFEGREDPILGWVSRRYHQKSPAITIVGRCTWEDRLDLTLRIGISVGRGDGRTTGGRAEQTVEETTASLY